ncbi:MAG: hypothetical protein MUP81_03340 [Dehalococcoidia bacterium]|nr:hypothetical protein [Dehalococcoidia bacterium]
MSKRIDWPKVFDKGAGKIVPFENIARLYFDKGELYSVLLWTGHALLKNEFVVKPIESQLAGKGKKGRKCRQNSGA